MAAAVASAGAIVLEVLNQDNYKHWSFRVKTYLLAKDLWDVVKNEPPKPETGYPRDPNSKYKVWEQKNAEALHAIQISCGTDIFGFISDTTSAKSAWDILADKFELIQRFMAGEITSNYRGGESSKEANYGVGESSKDANNGGGESSKDANYGGPVSSKAASYGAGWDVGDVKKLTPSPSLQREIELEIEAPDDVGGVSSKDANYGGVGNVKKWMPSRSLPHDVEMELEPTIDEYESDSESPYFESLHKAVELGKWDAAKTLLNENPNAIRQRFSQTGTTIVGTAIINWQKHIVEELLEMMKAEDLEIKDDFGCTYLIHAIKEGKGMTQIVAAMVKKNKKAATIRGPNPHNMSPVLLAYAMGHYEMARILYDVTPIEVLTGDFNNGRDGAELISHCFFTKNFDIAWDLIQRSPNLTLTTDHFGHSPLNALAGIRSAFLSGARLNFWQHWIYKWIKIPPAPTTKDLCLDVEKPEVNQGDDHQRILIHPVVGLFRGLVTNVLQLLGFDDIYEMKLGHVRTLEFVRCMRKATRNRCFSERESMFLQTALFRAAERGQVELIYHICKDDPSLLVTTDGKGRNLLQYAVECRQAQVYNLLYKLMDESYRSAVLGSADTFNNSILHLAGNLSTNLNHIRGAALQMQSELQWFKEVGSVVPPKIQEMINFTDHKTAQELFTRNHKELVKEAENSMKGTATSCTVVGALIVTMMFAAVFTLPGGNNQDTGFPVFLNRRLFMVFIISDSISLFSSTTSVMIFLGMLTSRYAEEDFLTSLPTKMILGLFTLFFSIAAMMIAFSSALVIMLESHSWLVIPVIFFASVPITSFVWLQFPLLIETCVSTYGGGMFDKKLKR